MSVNGQSRGVVDTINTAQGVYPFGRLDRGRALHFVFDPAELQHKPKDYNALSQGDPARSSLSAQEPLASVEGPDRKKGNAPAFRAVNDHRHMQ